MIASRTIETGDADIVIAGGAESMTRSPWVLMKPDRSFPAGDMAAVSTALGWRLINKRMPPEWTVSLGEANEQLREKFDISRERQDAFAYRSHQLAAQAWQDGFYDNLVTAVPDTDLVRDEGIRANTTLEKLATPQAILSARRHHHCGQCLATQRRRISVADGFRQGSGHDQRRSGREDRGPRRGCAGTADVWLRAGRGC